MSGTPSIKQIKKVVKELDLVFLKAGTFDSHGHPTVYVLFPSFEEGYQVRRVAYAGTPVNRQRALFRFKTKLRKIMLGRQMINPTHCTCLHCGQEKTADTRHICKECNWMLVSRR